jgi:hypothetical protein
MRGACSAQVQVQNKHRRERPSVASGLPIFNIAKDRPVYSMARKGGRTMPLVEVKVFEDELTQEQTKQLIQRITDAVTTVTSEKLSRCYVGDCQHREERQLGCWRERPGGRGRQKDHSWRLRRSRQLMASIGWRRTRKTSASHTARHPSVSPPSRSQSNDKSRGFTILCSPLRARKENTFLWLCMCFECRKDAQNRITPRLAHEFPSPL